MISFATSHAGCMRPRILIWMMRPRMLDVYDPAFLFRLCDLACWIHATPQLWCCQKVKRENSHSTQTQEYGWPYSHVHFTNSNCIYDLALWYPSSFHLHIFFLSQNSHSEQNFSKDQKKKFFWKDSIATFSHHLSVRIIEVILGPNYIFPLLNPYSYEKCLKKLQYSVKIKFNQIVWRNGFLNHGFGLEMCLDFIRKKELS